MNWALPIRDFARHLLVAMGDSDSAVVALQASLADPTLCSLAETAIRHARWHPHPEHRMIPDYNSPQSLTALRRLLFETAHHGDDFVTKLGKGPAVEIEAELEGSYPIEEPRHPHLGSGLPWPIVGKGLTQ